LHNLSHPQGNPFIVARRVEDQGLPTILGYGHGDLILGQEGAWSESANPFELRQEGDRLYGRDTADNKGQYLINLLALECVIAARWRLGFNATWLIEMGRGDRLA
jgi:acetylornithine deacetylase/succinyl-diaminopimelate desuccinylase-like protein